jgi:hypothetical protein
MTNVHPTIQVTWEFDLESDEELEGFEIVDDIGLERTASSALVRKVQNEIYKNTEAEIHARLDAEYDGTDITIEWNPTNVFDIEDFEGYEDEEIEEETQGMIEREDLSDLLSDIFKFVKQKHNGYVERGTSDINEGVYRIRIHDEIDYRRASTDHDREMLTNIELSNHFGVPVIIDLNDFFLPSTELDDEMITDALSDEYGWLVKSFTEI